MFSSLRSFFDERRVRDVFVLSNHEVAFEYFRWLLGSRGFRVSMVTPFNRGRHLLIKAFKEAQECVFYVKFNREAFHSFNFEFRGFVASNPEFAGHGESLNVESLEIAINRNAILVFVHEDGGVYFGYPKLIKNFCEKHGLIRNQKRENAYKSVDSSGLTQLVQERTYSFPLLLLQNFERLRL
jgi:hypothetical protein